MSNVSQINENNNFRSHNRNALKIIIKHYQIINDKPVTKQCYSGKDFSEIVIIYNTVVPTSNNLDICDDFLTRNTKNKDKETQQFIDNVGA